jgi:hypothetical protein
VSGGALLVFGLLSATPSLTIRSEPPGASVELDGKARGRTPLVLSLSSGAHALVLRAPGWLPAAVHLEVGRGEVGERSYFLTSALAVLDVETTKAGAEVSVDGAPPVAAPVRLRLPAGSHELVLRDARYLEARATAVLEEGVHSTVTLEAISAEPPPALPGRQQSSRTLLDELPGCSRDSQCKGARVCRASACEEPPADPPSLTAGLLRLEVIHGRILGLEASRPALGLPIALTVVGGLGMLGAAGTSVLFWLGTVTLLIAAGAAIPLTIGIIFLLIDGARNRRINREVRSLQTERQALLELAHF